MGVALSTILREKNKGCQDEGWKGEKEAKKNNQEIGEEQEANRSSRTVELDAWDRPRLEPTLERDNGHYPCEGKARDRDGQTSDHHDIISSLSHRGHGQVRGTKHEYQTAASQEESGKGFCRRSAGQC